VTERLQPLHPRAEGPFSRPNGRRLRRLRGTARAEIVVAEVGPRRASTARKRLRPLVSAITKIEADHMKLPWRHPRAHSGREAGIAKPGVTFVVGEREPRCYRNWCKCSGERHGRPVARGQADCRADVGCCRRRRVPGPMSRSARIQRRPAAGAYGILMHFRAYRPPIGGGGGRLRVRNM